MNLKEYIVVKSSTGSIDLWTKAVYKRYLDGHTIGDGTGHPYTAITTFNADDRLADIPSTEENAIREEAEEKYPYDPENHEWYTDSMVTDIQRAVHISCALSYIPQLKAKEARVRELEATIERLQGQLTRMADFMESEFRKK